MTLKNTTGRRLEFALLATILVAGSAYGVDEPQDRASSEAGVPAELVGTVHDAWLEGKVEMALLLNRYLNSFSIDTRVKASRVVLSGTVRSDIDRELAEQIALGINGVEGVENDLRINASQSLNASGEERARRFQQLVEDLTLTAQVKSQLILDRNITAADIDVATVGSVVTLEGQVRSGQERDLAVQIAGNTKRVAKVIDRLEVAATPAS